MREVTARRDVARMAHVDIAAVAAGTRVAADADVDAGVAAVRGRDVEIRVAAAAAHGLREQTRAAIAVGEDVAGVAHVDLLAVTRSRAIAADAEVQRVAVIVRETLREIDAAVAATAADRLRGETIRACAEGFDEARLSCAALDEHRTGMTTATAAAADAGDDRVAIGRDDAREVGSA